jgi:hypothetical protein
MTYTYSWEKTSTLSPLDFIQEQNNIFEEENEKDFDFDFLETDNFDELEIL